MAATPPPAPLREPRAPRHGAGYDSFDPYPTRHSARLATQQSADSHSTPPPPSPRKSLRQNLDTLSPPRTLSPRKKTARAKPRLDLDSSDLSDGAGSSLHRHSVAQSHSTLLPTPMKTPRNKRSHTDFSSAARSLFPAASSNSKTSKKPSGYSLGSFQEDIVDNHNSIEIYTDSRDRIPVLNESVDNPFLGNSEARMPVNKNKTEAKRRERVSRIAASDIDPKEAVKRDDGMLYTFRGKKVFRKFEEKHSDDEGENTDDELGFFAIRPDLLDSSVNLHVPRLTRSAIKGRRLFSTTTLENTQRTEETSSHSVDENEEATTDIEESVETTEGTDIVHSEADTEMPARRSLRTRFRDGDRVEAPHAAVVETKKKRGKSSSPFDIWARKKQSPAEVSTGKKLNNWLPSSNLEYVFLYRNSHNSSERINNGIWLLAHVKSSSTPLLANQKKLTSSQRRLPGAGVVKTILRSTVASPDGGFSWVLVDAEHGLISDKDYYELNNAIGSEGASPIIRVPWAEEWMIKRALDSGAHGIMTPMCHSAEDAARVVKYCKYPPTGSRGYGPMFAAHALPRGTSHDDGANDSLMVVVQIESRSGVENVEEIAKVDGIDVLFIGPFDLAKQTGVVRGGEEHEAMIQRTLKAAKAAGKKAAIFCTDGLDAQKRAEQGFEMVSIITDVGALGQVMLQQLDVAKGKGAEGQGKQRSGY
ncbi:hypothetical protein UA08_01609 [Talaromyces atroroseus]|uniref:HpcH/HpaI aldolase/citrate lyase domain-containing protein n=1 Tax=Talaromyces atroroseus TaxID=1441469 RepID=A0A1Q5QB50_TALAT|nr:hypothetical protein UA08_01609 [Talaromyces atroroseus]OKL63154.1 hypothetical protein UA08_01609 [Talaromyces atroroseus]